MSDKGGESVTTKDDHTIDTPEVIDVEKASKEQPKTMDHGKMLKWYILGGLLLVALVIFAIVVPIVMIKGPSNQQQAPVGGGQSPVEAFRVVAQGTGPFESTLKLFDGNVTMGYENRTELEEDLEQAAWFLINQVVKRNTGVEGYDHIAIGRPFWGGGRCFDCTFVDTPTADVTVGAPEGGQEDGAANKGGNGVGDNLNDHGTNNQEDDVEEGDFVVSDGEMGKWPRGQSELQEFLANTLRAFQSTLHTATTWSFGMLGPVRM